MNQISNIIDLAKELGLDEDRFDNQQDRLRNIAEKIGISNYNSLRDNDKLESALKERKKVLNTNSNQIHQNNITRHFINEFNSNKNKSARERIMRTGMKAAGLGAAANALENTSQSKPKKQKGIFGKLFDRMSGEDNTEKVKEVNEIDKVNISLSGTAKRILLAVAAGPLLSLFLILFITIFVIHATLDSMGVDADKILEKSSDYIEEKLENADDDTINKAANDLTYVPLSNSLNIYNAKLNKISILDATKTKVSGSTNEFADDFEIDNMLTLFSIYGDYSDNIYAYAFFYKLNSLNVYYMDKCGKQAVDLTLLMLTLKLQSDNMGEVFAHNIDIDSFAPGEVLNKEAIDKRFSEYYKYNYDFSDYVPTPTYSAHDMEVLVQNMVDVKGEKRCSYNEAKYKKYLEEFIKTKYYSDSTDENVDILVNDTIEEIYDRKELHDSLFGDLFEEADINYVTSNLYWWPIGSDEVIEKDGVLYAPGEPRTVNTSNGFGCTAENAWRTDGCHGGLDMGDGSAPGIVNVIAAKDGVVVYPTADYQTQYEDHGFYGNTEGGGYGNYVVIQHADGLYTVYGHLSKGSITVRANQTVKQGQVIAKMGHSGSSTGPHLHFTVGIGGIGRANVVDPLDYIDPTNPRPQNPDFSTITTVLTKNEFVAKMDDYCERSGNKPFCNNFAKNASGIYDVSVRTGVNPELVVVMAGAESWWYLSDSCAYTNNYWGIEIYNGLGCNGGGIYSNIFEGVEAFANVVSRYNPGGYYAEKIKEINKERTEAGCDPAGHGGPGSIEGMQTMYSTIGPYRYNPGGTSLGGCYYYDYIYNKGYCDTKVTCTAYTNDRSKDSVNCPAASKTTVCEYNDYTAWRVEKLLRFRRDIFGL